MREDICGRYARAAASWPGLIAPSHEQQARLLASLDDAAVALRAAATSTGRASDLLASTIGVVHRDEPRRQTAA
jgi:hypothetical protein